MIIKFKLIYEIENKKIMNLCLLKRKSIIRFYA